MSAPRTPLLRLNPSPHGLAGVFSGHGWCVASLVLVATALPLPALPGWSIQFLYGENEIFPSALVSVAESCTAFPPRHPRQLGDPVGLIAVEITAPQDDWPVQVTIDRTAIFAPSAVEVRLPRKGVTYRVAPRLVLDHAAIFALKHPIARELLVATVRSGADIERHTRAIRIWTINDCLIGILLPAWVEPQPAPGPDGRAWLDTHFLAAAYANENNAAVIDRVLRHALDRKFVSRFDGYESNDPKVVIAQVKAVYDAMHELGFKYSTVFRASSSSTRNPVAYAQRIRLGSDALGALQANCIDGTALMAAILTRIQLRAYIYIRPDHAFLGVGLHRDRPGRITVETTSVSVAPFEQALGKGTAQLASTPNATAFVGVASETLIEGDKGRFYSVDVGAARANGILPIAELNPQVPRLP